MKKWLIFFLCFVAVILQGNERDAGRNPSLSREGQGQDKKNVEKSLTVEESPPYQGGVLQLCPNRQADCDPLPCYLYKIISFRHWQATQNRKVVVLPAEEEERIRLFSEDQIERVMTTHWAKDPECVVLKMQRCKLQGRWVCEEGKEGKEYYLYKGLIPFCSIVESKIVYHRSGESCDMAQLDVVTVGDPVLRKEARELSKAEILSPEIQNLIEKMKVTMRAAPGVGLAAPQIGQDIQLIVIEDMDQSHLTAEQVAERQRYPVPFQVIINPRIYIDEKTTKVEFFEGCLSVPEFIGIVPRAESVKVECLNERAEPVVIQAKGWYARILQHEIDHLKGTLYIDRAFFPTIMTEENYVKLWKGKRVKEVKSKLMGKEQSKSPL